jgi:hypothetical protein
MGTGVGATVWRYGSGGGSNHCNFSLNWLRGAGFGVVALLRLRPIWLGGNRGGVHCLGAFCDGGCLSRAVSGAVRDGRSFCDSGYAGKVGWGEYLLAIARVAGRVMLLPGIGLGAVLPSLMRMLEADPHQPSERIRR